MNHANYIVPIITSICVGIGVYALTPDAPTLEQQAEIESQSKLASCMQEIQERMTFVEKQKIIRKCSEIKPIILLNVEESTTTGGVIPEAKRPTSKSISVECEWGEVEKIEGIEFHYTATDNDTTLQAIKKGHTSKYGSEHIGYHYVIKPDGEITNTRDEKCVAGADKWHKNNYRFIQVAFVGNDKPTKKQGESMAKLSKDIQVRYKLSMDAVSAHYEWGPKSTKESLEHWFGSKEEFIKMIRYYYVISIYGNGSPELQYMWRAWGDLDFIGTIFQESRMNNNSVGDGGNSIGYCQIHGQLQPGWQTKYKTLKTMEERLNYCHELYIYAKGLKGGVGSRFHGYNARQKHIKNISIQ